MKIGAKVRTYGQTYGSATPGDWIDIEKGTDKIEYGGGSYGTYKIVFHNSLASIYENNADINNF